LNLDEQEGPGAAHFVDERRDVAERQHDRRRLARERAREPRRIARQVPGDESDADALPFCGVELSVDPGGVVIARAHEPQAARAGHGRLTGVDVGRQVSTIMDMRKQQASRTLAVQGRLGDEVQLARAEGQGAGFDVVTPSVSVLVETPVAVVDKIASKHGTVDVATAYLRFLYTEEGQEIGARHGFRPVDDKVLRRHADQFPALALVSIERLGGWPALQAKHFADGGVFDQIFGPAR
jgi:hypothetical protein